MGPSRGKSRDNLPDFERTYPRTLLALEEAVHALLEGGWDEPLRRRAYEIATALSEGAKATGWKETGGVLQALSSLLVLPLEEVAPIRTEVREKLLELLNLLGESRASETA